MSKVKELEDLILFTRQLKSEAELDNLGPIPCCPEVGGYYKVGNKYIHITGVTSEGYKVIQVDNDSVSFGEIPPFIVVDSECKIINAFTAYFRIMRAFPRFLGEGVEMDKLEFWEVFNGVADLMEIYRKNIK